jgi:ubiquinone/menaquinone biosynthesis C-methylase UbiE
MEPDFQRRIQRYGWDKAAPYYESFWQNQLRPAQDLLIEIADLSSGERIVDIACGTGLVSFRALEKVGEKGEVLGADISDNMIQVASAIAKSLKKNHIQFKRMDAESLDIEDSKYDAALCALGLMYMPDPLKAIREMYRIIRPGGRAVAVVWGQRDHCGWAEIFSIVDKRVSSEVCPMFFQMGKPGMLKLSLENAGFSNVGVKTISTLLKFYSKEEACGAAFLGGPVALAYHKFSETIKREAEAEYLATVERYRRGEVYEVPGEFVVVKGRKKDRQ